MGSQESKVEQPLRQENALKETTLSESAPSSPILTPLDPRSPSANIARTPLDVVVAPGAVDEPQGDNNEVINDDEIENVILGVDPRSPTVEFSRTPIIVAAVPKEKSTKLQNKNLDNVRKSEIQTTPVTTMRKSPHVPPKLLESSPVSIISNFNKRKSFVGLLETNLDFTETDLDAVCQAKAALNKSLPVETTDDKLETQMEDLQLKTDSDSNVTPQLCDTTELVQNDDKVSTEKVINVTAQVKDFDKKLTNLIYEDGDSNVLTPRSMKAKENNRTPLGIRNSNEDSKKKNRLKVSDKPRKSEISRIPVFKDHCRRAAIQCENTPPRRMEEGHKNKISQWDADKTLII